MAAITVEQALKLASVQLQAGQLAAAEAICRQVLVQHSLHPEALHLLGAIASTTGRYGEALELLSKAVAQAPNQASYHSNLGETYRRMGRLEEAVDCFQRALALQPDRPDTLANLGAALMQIGRVDEAIVSCERGLSLQPGSAVAHNNLGAALSRKGDFPGAAVRYRRALSLDPNFAEAHHNLGKALSELAEWEEAAMCCQRSLALSPDNAEAHNDLGNALAETGRWDEAVASFRRAVALKPDYPEAHSNLGNALSEKGRYDEAIASHERALALAPNLAEAQSNLGTTYFREGKFEKALACFRQALAIRNDLAAVHCELAGVLLLLGRYEEGWPEYEWRSQRRDYAGQRRNFPAPQWRGTQVACGTILLHAEQGLGDTIQFVRYVALVRERSKAERVILECQPELTRLLSESGGFGAEVIARQSGDQSTLPPFDRHLSLLSLPFVLAQFEPLSPGRPYLRADPALRMAWRNRLAPDSMFRVGLAWAGNPRHHNDRRRSVQADKFLPLVQVPGMTFYSLQTEPSSPPTRSLINGGLIDLTREITDFADTAALMAELDLIISVDTAVAHLAGALGRSTWTLLPFVPDWRWGLEREDTPWYPTMRLFRQPKAGDWDSVIRRVVEELPRRGLGDGSKVDFSDRVRR